MRKFSCLNKFTSLVKEFHDGMLARVQDDGESSEPFLVTNSVKQGCVLVPPLFSMLFSAMLTDAFLNGDIGLVLDTVSTTSYSNCGDYSRRPRSRKIKVTSSSLTIVRLMPALSQKSGKREPALDSKQRLWFYSKYKEDRGDAPTRSCSALHWAQHHSRRPETHGGRQIRLPRQHSVKISHHWGRGHPQDSAERCSLRQAPHQRIWSEIEGSVCRPNSRCSVQLFCLPCCTPVKPRPYTVATPSSWIRSTWGASEICFTSNGRIGSQTQIFSRALRWWACTQRLSVHKSDERDMCATRQTSAWLRDYCKGSWKLVHVLTEVNVSDTKTRWRFPWSVLASILTPGRKLCKTAPAGAPLSTLECQPTRRRDLLRPFRSVSRQIIVPQNTV